MRRLLIFLFVLLAVIPAIVMYVPDATDPNVPGIARYLLWAMTFGFAYTFAREVS